VLQWDGNGVCYAGGHGVAWATATNGRAEPVARLVLFAQGADSKGARIELQDAKGGVVWQTTQA